MSSSSRRCGRKNGLIWITDEDFKAIGVPEEWIPWLRKSGFNTIEALKKANPNKLANDLNGIRKKNKLEISPLSPDLIERWLSLSGH